MIWRPPHHVRIAQLADACAVAFSFVFAHLVWKLFNFYTSIGKTAFTVNRDDIWKILVFSLIWVAILAKFNAYSQHLFTSIGKEIWIILKATAVGILVFFALSSILRFRYFPRSYVFIFAIINPICLTAEKLFLFYVARITRKKKKLRRKILIAGTGEKARHFIQTLQNPGDLGLEIIGYLSQSKVTEVKNIQGRNVLGSFTDITDVLKKNLVDEVVICVSEGDFPKAKRIIEACEKEGIQIRLYSDFFGRLLKSVSVDNVSGIPIVSFYTIMHDEWALYLKRFFDIAVSSVLLILSAPFFIIIPALIKMTSKGPVFFQWRFLGLNKKPVTSYKFRTMIVNAEEIEKELRQKNLNEMENVYFKLKHDFRITPLGRILRKFSLDELPQLYSVLKGDMSIIGPRPVRQLEKDELHDWHRRRFSIRPGVTSPWVVKGKNKITDFDEIAKLDLDYIENWSLWLDFKIILQTIPIIVLGRNN